MNDFTKRESGEEYLFVAFCEEDSRKIIPILDKLYRDGLRMWYEDSRNKEETAEKLKNASAYLFFFSPQAIDQHVFANKLIYALGVGKPIVSFFLQPTELPLGMSMQISQGKILQIEEEYSYTALLNTVCIKACRGALRPAPKKDTIRCAIVREKTGEIFRITEHCTSIGRYSDQANQQADIALKGTKSISRMHAQILEKEGRYYLKDTRSKMGTLYKGSYLTEEETIPLENGDRFILSKEHFLFFTGENAYAEAVQAVGSEVGSNILVGREDPTLEEKSEKQERRETGVEAQISPGTSVLASPAQEDENDQVDEMTIRISNRSSESDLGSEATIRQIVHPALLLRLHPAEAFVVNQIETVIGRKSNRKHADIMLEGNPEISRVHATLYQYGDKYMIRDSGSLSGTYVNGEKVDTNTAAELKMGDRIELAREKLLFLCGESAESWIAEGSVCLLQSMTTGELRVLDPSGVKLDRNHPWKENLLKVPTVSRNHAVIFKQGSVYSIRDTGSTNGTFVNDVEVPAQTGKIGEAGTIAIPLKAGDKISIAEEEFRFLEYQIRKGEYQ